MMLAGIFIFLLFFVKDIYAQCSICDTSCGDWSCITNCGANTTNPQFDTMRCFNDANGNGILDDCSEIPACTYTNGKWVCPTDLGDAVCNGSCGYTLIKFKDTNPQDFDAPYYTYARSGNTIPWSQYSSNSCGWQFPDLSKRQDIWSLFGQGPFWIKDGVLYWDVWFSFVSYGQYVDFTNRCWIVKDLQYSNFPYYWQRIGRGCIPRTWRSRFCVTAYRCGFDGRYYRDYNTCVSNCSRWKCSVNWFTYSDYNTCVSNCSGGYCYQQTSCQSNTQCTYFTWNANVSYTQTNYYYDWRTWTNYQVNLSCVSWGSVDAIYGCGSTAYKQRKDVCLTYYEYVSPTGEWSYLYPDTSWPYCSNYMSRWGSMTTSYYSGSFFDNFGKVVENRTVPQYNYGVLFYPDVKCKPCGSDLSSIGAGVTKRYDPPPQEIGDLDQAGMCRQFRFFPGELRKCRPGGLTILGASCCGVEGWFKWMCNNEEKELKKKRYAGLCRYVGDYCSVKILGICIETKRSFCCFYSRIGKIVQECGRPQLGISWGTGRNPDCRGLDPEEFAKIDLGKPECKAAIEEYFQSVATGLDTRVQDMQTEALERVQNWMDNPSIKY